MSVGEWEWDEILDRYEAISSDYWDGVKDDHLSEIQDDEQEVDRIQTEYRNKRNESKSLTEQQKTVISGFLPGNTIANSTGWEFRAIEPLRNLDSESPDLVIGHPETGSILAVTMLRQRERPETAINRVTSAATTIRSNTRLLSDEINMSVDDRGVECVLIVPESADRRSAEAIEDLEGSGDLTEEIYLWKIVETDKEKIEAHTQIGSRDEDECLPDGDLGEYLSQGIEVAKSVHSLPDFFAESHHEIIAEHTVGEMVSQRKRDGGQITHFSKSDFEDYLRTTLSHSNSANVASERAELLLKRWEEMGLIESITDGQTRLDDGSDYYRFDTGTRTAKNTMGAVRSDYTELAVDFELNVEATRRTLREYIEENGEQASLNQFETV
ncbi:hypothetical protein [Haloarchaeobius sp. HRN-SO-5]|uniref:hypothetical protein n=1 Tax=Haloarchaeobius sp. HRN-SO-5 TaxID=3446118 RepID=UPI003EB8DB9F